MGDRAITGSVSASDDAGLRSDVRRLGDLLGETLVRQEGPELLALVEAVRKAGREGGGADLLASLSVEDSVQLVRTCAELATALAQIDRFVPNVGPNDFFNLDRSLPRWKNLLQI